MERDWVGLIVPGKFEKNLILKTTDDDFFAIFYYSRE